MALEFSERVSRLPSYPVAGGYAEDAPVVRLASNESPYPPLTEVREAIERELGTLNRYPDPTNSLLRARLSDRYGVPAARIAIGNGSCDVLLAAGEAPRDTQLDPVELAAYTTAAGVILNLDEVITRQ